MNSLPLPLNSHHLLRCFLCSSYTGCFSFPHRVKTFYYFGSRVFPVWNTHSYHLCLANFLLILGVAAYIYFLDRYPLSLIKFKFLIVSSTFSS